MSGRRSESNKRRQTEKEDLQILNSSFGDIIVKSRALGSDSWKDKVDEEREKIGGLVQDYSVAAVGKCDDAYEQSQQEHDTKMKQLAKQNAELRIALAAWNERNQHLSTSVGELQAEKKRLAEEKQQFSTRVQGEIKDVQEDNKRLWNTLYPQIEENQEIKSLQELLDHKDRINKTLKDTEGNITAEFADGKRSIELDDDIDASVLKKIQEEHQAIEREQMLEIKKLEDESNQNFKRARKVAASSAKVKFENMIEALKKEKEARIAALRKEIKRLEDSLASYQGTINVQLKVLNDLKVSLRMEIKAYELLIKEECDRLGLPHPKFKRDELKASDDEKAANELSLTTQQVNGSSHTDYVLTLQNTSLEVQSLKGYSLRSKLSTWKFPDDAKIETRESLQVYCGGSNPGRRLQRNEIFVPGFKFEAPEDLVELINLQGEVVHSEPVFSRS